VEKAVGGSVLAVLEGVRSFFHGASASIGQRSGAPLWRRGERGEQGTKSPTFRCASVGDGRLRARPAPGRPRKLAAWQVRKLPALLLRGALAFGYSTDLWTTS
jgi:hypothetical protein